MKNNSIASIIISGGYSSRMGSFKPFLNFGEKSAVEMIVDTYKSSGIHDIIVVAGYKGSEVAEKLKGSDVLCIQNENYAEGMFTSVIKGVKALDGNVAAFFMPLRNESYHFLPIFVSLIYSCHSTNFMLGISDCTFP